MTVGSGRKDTIIIPRLQRRGKKEGRHFLEERELV